MNHPAFTRESLSGDALMILKNLRENGRLGRSNKLADVKASLEPSVSLDFDTYFFFLRKFHYIAMDREAQLKLTEEGERVVDGREKDKFLAEVSDFFAEQLDEGSGTRPPEQPSVVLPPPPPLTEVLLDAHPMSGSPPPKARMKPPPPPGDDHLSPHLTSKLELPELKQAVSAADSPRVGNKGTDIDLRYVKFDAIGSGPLGTVFKGRHNALNLDICVKELKDIFGYFSFLQRGEVIKRLKKELCAQAQVRHPGIVAVLDQNTDVARPYYVMELLRGSMRELLDQNGGKGLPVGQAIRLFLQLAYGLKAAHATGLTHHNLKPENVLFDAYGNARLSDFGLSRVIEVDQSKGMPQVFVGTGGMAYMAPELIARSKDAGPSADIYGLGILLYEMLTGQIPGRRSPLPSEVNAEVPTKLDPVFDKMTQDRRESRYPDFDAMLDEFYGAFSEGEYLARGDLLLWSEPPPK